MYLKQKGLKISGSKAELIDRVLTHARGNLSAGDAVEDEEYPIHAKTTQAQSPVILMTLQMTLPLQVIIAQSLTLSMKGKAF